MGRCMQMTDNKFTHASRNILTSATTGKHFANDKRSSKLLHTMIRGGTELPAPLSPLPFPFTPRDIIKIQLIYSAAQLAV